MFQCAMIAGIGLDKPQFRLPRIWEDSTLGRQNTLPANLSVF